MAQVQIEPRRVLRVSCPVTLAQTVLGELLPQFLLRHPLLRVDVADDLLTLKFAVLSGVGMSMLPDYLCENELAEGRLVEVLPGWAPTPGLVHAVYASRRGLVPAVLHFLDFLGEHMVGHRRV